MPLIRLGRFFALPVFMVVAAKLLFDQTPTAWALFNIAAAGPLIALIVAAHEGGHVLAGRALGFTMAHVELGTGRNLLRWRGSGTAIRLNAFPSGGVTYLGGSRDDALRWRMAGSIAAGPLATLASIGLFVLMPPRLAAGDMLLPFEAVATRPALRELFVFLSLVAAAGNILPLYVFGRRKGANDGSQLLRLPFVKAAELRESLVVPAVLEAHELSRQGDHDGAERLLEKVLRFVPDSWGVRYSQATALLEWDRLREARELLLDLAARDVPAPECVWLLRNNLAWVDFRLRDEALRAEADECSAAAVAQATDVPCVLGTRGAVLVWSGRHHEALPLLKRAYRFNLESHHRALNACCLAWACAALGRRTEAHRWIERARRKDPRCPLLVEAEAALAPSHPA
jgi:hypothetical protein